jgi:type IV secretion system protein VirB4
MVRVARERALRRERSAADSVPYRAQLNEFVIRTAFGDYIQVFRLAGAGFQSADDEQLNNWHERLNILWRNIASPNIALWTHIVRRHESGQLAAPGNAGFADQLYRKYYDRLRLESLMSNELYLTTVYRPTVGLATGIAAKIWSGARRDAAREENSQALELCEKLSQTVVASLARYDPTRLGSYLSNGVWYSSLLEFLGTLLNAESRSIPLPRGPLSHSLTTSRLLFGAEAIEYRSATSTRVSAVLGIKEYPTPNVVGMFNRLLSAPFAFVLTQSFAFLSKAASEGLLQRQLHRMHNAGDFGISQSAQLHQALDALSSNEFVFGDHHCTLQIIAQLPEQDVAKSDALRLKPLNDQIALARSVLADTGMTVAREDLALEAAFWAQLPGNFALRPRKAPITSRNFAAMSAFHNFPSGRATNNHWGDALAMLMTSAQSPYHFSLHASDPKDPDGGSRKDTGHTFICGPTGSGKTVFIGFLVTMLSRLGATQIVFDKDCGLEILVRALGGEYFPLKNAAATGFNPLQLPDCAGQVEFLKTWLRCLVRQGRFGAPSVQEQADLDQALHGTLALDRAERRLSRLIEFLDPTKPDGCFARLAPWCVSTRGDYAWVFDNERDLMVARLQGRPIIGFDVTEFLDHDIVRAPVSLYLFHLIRQLLDGRPLVCWMDEFWRLLGDPAFESFAKDGPKTWRKLNAVMCLATQSASDVLGSSISRTIVEQTPTKILFPNPDASFQEYTEGFGLSAREFSLIKERLEPGSRQFLIKQGHYSIVCKLDLKGFDRELRVISGRTAEVNSMRQAIERHGPHPECWLPEFLNDSHRSTGE